MTGQNLSYFRRTVSRKHADCLSQVGVRYGRRNPWPTTYGLSKDPTSADVFSRRRKHSPSRGLRQAQAGSCDRSRRIVATGPDVVAEVTGPGSGAAVGVAGGSRAVEVDGVGCCGVADAAVLS